VIKRQAAYPDRSMRVITDRPCGVVCLLISPSGIVKFAASLVAGGLAIIAPAGIPNENAYISQHSGNDRILFLFYIFLHHCLYILFEKYM
jgi:hypothetical protein